MIRVAWLLSPGSPDATPSEATGRTRPGGHSVDSLAASTMLGRRPTLDDVGNAAAFLSSDWARTMTATEVNLTAGSVVD